MPTAELGPVHLLSVVVTESQRCIQERGAATVEYGLVMAVTAVAAIGSAELIGDAISALFRDVLLKL